MRLLPRCLPSRRLVPLLALLALMQAVQTPVLADGLRTASPLALNRLLPWYQGQRAIQPETHDRRWWVEIGAEAGLEPDYVGSDDYEFEPFPYLSAYYAASPRLRFRLTPETIGAAWEFGDNTVAQLLFESEDGREASATKDLSALEDGPDTIEAELTLAHRFGRDRSVFAYATWQPEVKDRGKGVVYFVGLGKQFQPAPRWLLTASADVSWGDAEHMTREFGIDAADSRTLGVDAYTIGGGIKSSTANITAEWRLRDRLSLFASGEAEYYYSDAAKSPLLDELGSRTTYEVELAIVYRF